jgi:hypothetical protein
MRLTIGGVLLTLAFLGCGGDDANEPEPPIEVAGSWSGRTEPLGGEEVIFAFSFSEAAGVVQGSGVLGGGDVLESIDIEGTYEEPEVALTISAEGLSRLALSVPYPIAAWKGT